MDKIIFDSGVKEFRINGSGVLRFNPGDPNLYARFLDGMEEVKALEQSLSAKAKELGDSATGEAVLRLMQEADKQLKQVLSRVFGGDNDLDQALGGMNLLAVTKNGSRVITNLLEALQPVLVEGAEKYAKAQADDAVARAKAARGQRSIQP